MTSPKPKMTAWIAIVLVILGLFGGAGAWAVAEHDKIEARAEARVLRSEDRQAAALNRIENKIDQITEFLLEN